MTPMDYRRCADCHNSSCEGCDNTVALTRADFKRLEAREAIITRISHLSNEAESLADYLLNSSDSLFQGIDDRAALKVADAILLKVSHEAREEATLWGGR